MAPFYILGTGKVAHIIFGTQLKHGQ